MTRSYAQLHARRHSVSQLGNVVTAMRGMAAARAQQSQQQLENVQLYAQAVAKAMSQVLAISSDVPLPGSGNDGGLATLLFCAEHGFAGAFSENILDSADTTTADRILLIVGARGARLADARGWKHVWYAPMVSHLTNAGLLADRIATELYRQLHAGRVNRVDVVHARPQSSDEYVVVRQSLLPLDYSRFGKQNGSVPPLLNLAPQALMAGLAAEYLFAQLNEAIVHSYAAENSARLRTMTAARENIARRLETLMREEQVARQQEITAEIIELAEGVEALSSSKTP